MSNSKRNVMLFTMVVFLVIGLASASVLTDGSVKYPLVMRMPYASGAASFVLLGAAAAASFAWCRVTLRLETSRPLRVLATIVPLGLALVVPGLLIRSAISSRLFTDIVGSGLAVGLIAAGVRSAHANGSEESTAARQRQ
jgi:hypothetical protein